MELMIAGVVGGDLVHRLFQGVGVVGKHRHLVGQGGVDDDIGPVLEGGDVLLLAPAHIIPHQKGFQKVCAPEIIVTDRPAGNPHPGALEPQFLPLQHVGAGGDVQAGGLRVTAEDVVIEGVDALENGDLVLVQLQKGAPAVVAHLAGKLILGHHHPLAPGQLGESLVQQVQVQQHRRLVVDVPLGGAGGGLAVEGLIVVVHGDGVGVHPPALQLLLQLEGGGGLARAGGAGQQHDGADLHPLQNTVHRRVNAALIGGVAGLQKSLGIGAEALVDLLQLIGHRGPPYRAPWKRATRSFPAQTASIFSIYSLGYLGLAMRSMCPVAGFTSLVTPPPPRETMVCSSSIMQML